MSLMDLSARRRQRFLERVHTAFGRLRGNPRTWSAVERERRAWDATLGELHRRCGHRERALSHTRRALASAPTNPEKSLLERRLQKIAEGTKELSGEG